jgi:hypothetical protein
MGPCKESHNSHPSCYTFLILSFYLRLIYFIRSYPFKLKLRVISAMYAASLTPEVLGIIGVLFNKGSIPRVIDSDLIT